MRRFVIACFCITIFASSASAQFYYFGRNKVQYTEFEWKVLKTEHFDIYYYQEMEELAERGAYFAEESYKLMEQKFNHNISGRIPLIFYSSHLHFQQTNVTPGFLPEGIGGFFEFLKGRVVIPYLGSIEQFAHVIRHELVHVFMHSKINRVLLDHRQTQDRAIPSWFTEGLAEFWSTEWDTQAEMVIRDAVINNYIIPVADMDRIYGSFLLYKEGQKVLEFIAERYGEETILLLMENFWKASTFSEVMRHTIGKSYKELDEEWLYHLKKKYYPLIGTEDLPSVVTKNVVDVGFNHKPVFYQNGDKREVYFVGNHTGYTSIYRTDLNAEKPRVEEVIEGEKSDEFEAFHLFQSKMDISRDGILAFVTKSGENDALHLYDVTEDELVETIRFRSLVVLTSPSWSPDGKNLVFAGVEKSGNNDLYLLEVATRTLTRLTNDHYDDRDPAWSPDGNRIAFSSDRAPNGNDGIYNIFLYDIRTSAIEYLTTGEHHFNAPAWSPDGRWLAFTSDFEGAQNIWLMKADERILANPDSLRLMRKITNFTTASFDPAWTDNDEMVFVAFENFSFQIKRIFDTNERYDSSASQHAFFYDAEADPWVPKKIEGESVLGEYHYDREYRLDIAQSQIATDPIFGTYGGAALAMSDMLGNDQYYFLVYNTAQASSEFLESFNVAISRISLGTRANHAYGIFHFAGNRYDLTDPDLFFYERSFGGYFALSYPLTKFKRVETSLTVSNSDKDILLGDLPRKALMTSSSISFVWDNSLWGPSGPVDGNRMKLTLAYTTDVQFSNVDYYTIIADYRHYWRIATRSAFASRINLWYNEGKEARRFFMGGSWDLRGWPRWSIRGEKIWFTSHELRFPFIDVLGVRFPFGGINFGSFRGAIFADFGGAWDDNYKDTKGSIGTGVRFNLGGIIVLRYDIGKRIENDLSQFQEGIFHQFFFGWDF
ncbi:MAG: BamA/TamA family outer membrane protein [Ignavibacteriae bacterium]|nr:BamA/TamA family outer membrane protein [Ignavibacteriota bacterium]